MYLSALPPGGMHVLRGAGYRRDGSERGRAPRPGRELERLREEWSSIIAHVLISDLLLRRPLEDGDHDLVTRTRRLAGDSRRLLGADDPGAHGQHALGILLASPDPRGR